MMSSQIPTLARVEVSIDKWIMRAIDLGDNHLVEASLHTFVFTQLGLDRLCFHVRSELSHSVH